MLPETLGLAAILAYLLFLPLTFNPDLSTFCLLALGLTALLSAGGLRPRLGRVDYAIIALVVISAAVSSLVSVDPARSARYAFYLCLNIFLLLLASSMVSQRSVKIIAIGLASAGVIHLVALVCAGVLGSQAEPAMLIRQLNMGTLIVPNDAIILGLCLPAVFFASQAANRINPRYHWMMVSAYVALSLVVSLLLQSKLALLGLLTAGFVLVSVRVFFFESSLSIKTRITGLLGGFALMLVLSAAVFYFGNQSTTRLSLWSAAVSSHDTAMEVVFGAGPNTFEYQPEASSTDFDTGNFMVPWVHNIYLEAYYDQGLVGVAGLLALTILPLTRAARVESGKVRALLLASMMTFCLLALLEITLTRRFYFAFLAVMYGLARAQSFKAGR